MAIKISCAAILRKVLLILLFLVCHRAVIAQQKYAPESFKDWYHVINSDVSNDGQYSLIMRRYDDQRRELVFLKNGIVEKETDIPMSKTFLNNDIFLLLSRKGDLEFEVFKSKKKYTENDVRDFYISQDTGLGYVLKKDGSIKFFDGNQLIDQNDVSGIEKIKISIDNRWVLAMTKNTSFLLPLAGGKIVKINFFGHNNLLQWRISKADGNFNFLIQSKDIILHIVMDRDGKKLEEHEISKLDKGFVFSGYTDTGKLVAVRSTKEIDMKDSLEIWKTEDLAMRPNLNRFRGYSFDARIIDPQTDEVFESPYVEGETQRSLVFSDHYMLEERAYANEDFTDNGLIPEIRLKNIKNKEIEFTVKRSQFYIPAENGKLYYFEDKDWWVYDVQLKQRINLTKSLNESFFVYNSLNRKKILPAGFPYFSKDGALLYLSSDRNIWAIDTRTYSAVNLTRSNERKRSFKILNKINGSVEKMRWADYRTIQDDFLVLKILDHDEAAEGLAVYKNDKLIPFEALNLAEIDQILIRKDIISYTIENAGMPPEIRIFNVNSKKKKNVYHSNTKNYHKETFPNHDLIQFKDSKGRDSYVGVVLPSDYNPTKEYPAIVRIYENTAASLKTFVYPTFYNQSGYNRSLSAMNGYITILPRIIYEQNKPGESALFSVEEALKITSKKYMIDHSRLGIIGESFGGFETNYIIANTGIFKTAVSGVSLSDITASYFSMNKKFLRPDIWRYTDQSYRFSGNFYDLKEVYIKQNPVFHADRIQTPLLLWTGKEDYHVNWEQSVAMFIALKSLQKKTELILFPKDGHALAKPENQIQATSRIMRWFDQYLK